MAWDRIAPRRRHHARHNKMVRRMSIINRKQGSAKAWRFKTSRHRRRHNPGHDADFVKHFRDGGRIEVWNDGEVCVFDSMDRDMDDFHIKPHEVPNLIRDVNAAKFGAWHHYTKDMIRDDYEMQGRGKRRNPRGRKRGGRSFTRARKGRDWERAVHSSLPWFANPRRGRGRRRNPDIHGNAGKAHPAYGQFLMKLGFAMNDPIVELGAAWARGEAASSRLINQAIISAERSMESRDRRVAQTAKNVANKLRSYLKEQERHEGYRHKSGYKPGTLVGAFRYARPGELESLGRNPRRRRKARR